jgi:hypothetical protein
MLLIRNSSSSKTSENKHAGLHVQASLAQRFSRIRNFILRTQKSPSILVFQGVVIAHNYTQLWSTRKQLSRSYPALVSGNMIEPTRNPIL